MSTQILIKRSTTTGAVPTTSDIAVGELAINTVDKRIFTNNSGTIVELGTTPTTQAVTGNASVGGTFDVVGAVTVGNFTADGTVDLTAATVTIPAPTADTHPATKKYVDDEVNAILDGAPAALNTLNEIAAAINDDANLYTTLTNSIATKLSLAGGTMTGSIDMGANSITTSADPATSNTLTRKSYVDGLYQSTVDAEVSAANALASEQAAATSATNSATSASASATSASAASTSATNAASSATAAASSATSSANSATASATSATQSAASATQAQALVDSIESFYLGAEASAPTVDDNGDPLQAGDWYFNTTDNATYIYNGSSWQSVSPDVVADLTPQLGGNLDTNGNDVLFGDNNKAIFGAGSDLQIYHNGSASVISDTGTGNFFISGDNDVFISKADLSEVKAKFSTNGAVSLYYDNAQKFSTTSTGIDVTGTATMDGLTVDGNTVRQNGVLPFYLFMETDTTDLNTQLIQTVGQLRIRTVNDAITTATERMRIDHATGDISFYEDTGTTAKFFWDASAEQLTLDNSTSTYGLDITGQGNGDRGMRVKNETNGTAARSNLRIENAGGIGANLLYPATAYTGVSGWANRLILGADGASNGITLRGAEIRLTGDDSLHNPDLVVTSAGNVGIGTASPDNKLTIGDSTSIVVGKQWGLDFQDTGKGEPQAYIYAEGRYDANYNTDLTFGTIGTSGSATERMRIDSSGNVGIGTTSPDFPLSVYGVSPTIGVLDTSGNGSRIELTANNTSAVINASYSSTAIPMIFNMGVTERMRLDASGNLLVGKTGSNTNNVGIELQAGGIGAFTASGANPVLVNRNTSDGDLILLRKDGATVGSIGTNGNRPYFSCDSTGIKAVGDDIRPVSASGADNDATVNLGDSAVRWKDLYLSGGVYLGGTGAANYLDDYEEGTWTPVLTDGTTSYTLSGGTYVKVGNIVHVRFDYAATNATAATTGNAYITGLPFTVKSGYGKSFGSMHLRSTVVDYNALTDGQLTIVANPAATSLDIISMGLSNDYQKNVALNTIINTGGGTSNYIGVSITYEV